LLGKVQPKRAVVHRLCGVLQKLALRRSRDAMLPVIKVVFRETGTSQQRRYGGVLFAKGGNRLPCGKARCAWQNLLDRVLSQDHRSKYKSSADLSAGRRMVAEFTLKS
jgi:hypothetical protein